MLKKTCLLLFVSCFLTALFVWFPVKAGQEDANKPDRVEDLVQTGGTSTSLILEWKAITQRPAFVIELSDKKNDFSKAQKTYSGYDNVCKIYDGLNPGSTYYVRVRAYNGTRETPIYGDYSETLTCYTSPESIAGLLKQGATGTNSVTIQWPAAKGATLYYVYMQNDYDSDGVLVGETKDTSYTFRNLSAASTYPVYVTSVAKSGNYVAESSSKSITIKTAPGKPKVATTDWNQVFKTITFEWKNPGNVDGYQLQLFNYKGKKVKTFDNVTLKDYPSPKAAASPSQINNEYKDLISVPYSPTAVNVGFTYRTRAYVIVEGTKIYGAWTAKKGLIASPSVKSIRRKNRKTATLKWNKIKGAASYTLYRSTNSQNTYKKIKTLKGNSYKIKKLKKKNFYYFYVIANQKIGKKTYKSQTKIIHFMR